MPLLIVGISIVILLILMLVFRLNAFFSLLIAAFMVGIMNGLGASATFDSIIFGMGDTLGSIVLILVFGAMLGNLIEESGAAVSITSRLNRLLGPRYIQWVFVLTGFLVGLPMIYNASFLVLIPLVYAFASKTKYDMLYLGIPMSAALSVAHGYLPPHPAPVAVSAIYGANVNTVLLYGLVPCIPAILVAGIGLSKCCRNIRTVPPENLYVPVETDTEKLPSLSISIFSALFPVLLILAGMAVKMIFPEKDTVVYGISDFISKPDVALFISVIIAVYALGIRRNRKMQEIMKCLEKSVSGIAMVLMIIAAGGALKQVIYDSGVADYIGHVTTGMKLNPLLLAWITAALLRLAIGSATVATITAAGMLMPLVASSNLDPALMVLATGSGSLMFSHFNDVGFWMFKEYYNVSVKETFLIWTVMESLVGIVGLVCALLLDLFL